MGFGDFVLTHKRVSDQVKDLIKACFLQGDLKLGDRLPGESEIAAQLKVSRGTVREAFKDMEAEGFVEKRRGIAGGRFITKPDLSKLDILLSNYCRFGTIASDEVADFRQVLEPALLAAAAARRTEKDLEALRVNLAEAELLLDAGHSSVSQSITFHRLIAAACHNNLLTLVVNAFLKLVEDLAKSSFITLKESAKDLEYHKVCYEFILHGDAGRAGLPPTGYPDMFSRIAAQEKFRRFAEPRDLESVG
jgi:GntR family transcriptional regulator, transcriptional repressor for pyruvate dehydrogenase complex